MTIFQNGHRNATVWRLVQIEWYVLWRNGLWCVYLWQVHRMSTLTCRCAVSVSVIYTSHVPVYRWYWDYNAFNQKRIWWRQALVRAITQVLPSSNEQYIRVLEIFLITHCKTYFKNKSLIHYFLEKACSSLTTLSHRSMFWAFGTTDHACSMIVCVHRVLLVLNSVAGRSVRKCDGSDRRCSWRQRKVIGDEVSCTRNVQCNKLLCLTTFARIIVRFLIEYRNFSS